MALVWQGPKSRSALITEMLAPSLGQGLANFTGNYLANKALDSVVSDGQYKDKPLSEKWEALQTRLSPYGQFGENVFNRRMGIEQKMEEEKEKRALADITSGKEISPEKLANLSPRTQLEIQKIQAKKKESKSIYEGLIGLGVPEERARHWQGLYENAPQGGQSEIIRGLNEDIRRAQSGEFKIPGEAKADLPDAQSFVPSGLLPKERVEFESGLRKTNQPIFEDLQTQTRFLKKEKNALNILNDLNERGNLPEGFDRVLIDPETGDLRPYAQVIKGANPDTQRFIKTVYDFTTQAKDSFGARVTNFDLQSFLKRLPSLMNTQEGRRQIIDQMKIINQLNDRYSNSLKGILTHYGLGKVPYEKAVQLAENQIADEEEQLVAKFEKIGTSDQKSSSNPAGKIKVRSPSGVVGHIPSENLEKAKKAGYDIID